MALEETKTPKLNLKKSLISSSVFSGASIAPKVSFGGLAKAIGSQPSFLDTPKLDVPKANPLADIVSQLQVKFESLSSTVRSNVRKITLLKRVLEAEKKPFGGKEDPIEETNRILVEIQNQLALDFASRIAEKKEKLDLIRDSILKKKQKEDEEDLEKVNKNTRETNKKLDKVIKPARGIFDKILEFFSLFGGAVIADAGFKWLSDPENQKKLTGIFDWLTGNWEWIAGGLAIGGVLAIAGSLALAVSGIWGTISLIGTALAALSPIAWPILAIAALAGGTFAAMNWVDRMQNRRKWGDNEEFISRGIKTRKVLVQYGLGASEEERDKHLTKEEKGEYQMLLIYDGMLQRRGKDYNQLLKWQKQMASNEKSWAKRGLDINNLPEFEQGVYDRVAARVAEFQEKVDTHNRQIAGFESQFTIKGETIEDVYSRFPAFGPGVLNTVLGKGQTQWNTSLPQTGISEAGDKNSAYGLGYSIRQNKNGMNAGGTVIGEPGYDKINAKLTLGEEVITMNNNIAENFRPALKDINNYGGEMWKFFADGTSIMGENNEKYYNILNGYSSSLFSLKNELDTLSLYQIDNKNNNNEENTFGLGGTFNVPGLDKTIKTNQGTTDNTESNNGIDLTTFTSGFTSNLDLDTPLYTVDPKLFDLNAYKKPNNGINYFQFDNTDTSLLDGLTLASKTGGRKTAVLPTEPAGPDAIPIDPIDNTNRWRSEISYNIYGIGLSPSDADSNVMETK